MEPLPTIAPTHAYIGCFTSTERRGHGKGISVYAIDQATGEWKLTQVLATIPNPQFLALDCEQRFLYSAHGDGTEIGAYAINRKTGELTFLNKQPTGGRNSPCLLPDPTNRCMVLANGPGVAIFPINGDGSLAPFSDTVVPPGPPGPYRREQAGPHPHQVLFDPSGRYLLAPDKGVDKIHVYRLDAATGKLTAHDPPCVNTRYGAGPRHLAFHPSRPFAYAINELDSTVTAYYWDGERGELKPLQVITTLPTTYTGNNTGAEIALAPNGNFVYASNRGHDSIAIFALDQQSGMLDTAGWEWTQGKKPRFFAIEAHAGVLYAANQDSDSIIAFAIDPENGKLTPTGNNIATGTPSCIVFASLNG